MIKSAISLANCICVLFFLTACKENDSLIERHIIKKEFVVPTDTALSCKQLAELVQRSSEYFTDAKTSEELLYTLSYRPWQLMACRECDNEISDSLFEQKRRALSGLSYFNISVSGFEDNIQPIRYRLNDENQVNERTERLAFDMQSSFKMVAGKDTIDCVLYHYEQGSSITLKDQFLIAFPAIDYKKNHLEVLFNDKEYTKELMRFTIPIEAISTINKLRVL